MHSQVRPDSPAIKVEYALCHAPKEKIFGEVSKTFASATADAADVTLEPAAASADDEPPSVASTADPAQLEAAKKILEMADKQKEGAEEAAAPAPEAE